MPGRTLKAVSTPSTHGFQRPQTPRNRNEPHSFAAVQSLRRSALRSGGGARAALLGGPELIGGHQPGVVDEVVQRQVQPIELRHEGLDGGEVPEVQGQHAVPPGPRSGGGGTVRGRGVPTAPLPCLRTGKEG